VGVSVVVVPLKTLGPFAKRRGILQPVPKGGNNTLTTNR
jgi:hypothetical protein